MRNRIAHEYFGVDLAPMAFRIPTHQRVVIAAAKGASLDTIGHVVGCDWLVTLQPVVVSGSMLTDPEGQPGRLQGSYLRRCHHVISQASDCTVASRGGSADMEKIGALLRVADYQPGT